MTDDEKTEQERSAEDTHDKRDQRSTPDDPADYDEIAEEEKDDNPG